MEGFVAMHVFLLKLPNLAPARTNRWSVTIEGMSTVGIVHDYQANS